MNETPQVGYYESLNFNNPMTDQTADHLVAQLAANNPSHVLDVGCGWAELLLRLLSVCQSSTGHGVDHDEALIERAKRHADERGLSNRVTFSAEIGDHPPTDLVMNVGAEHVFGTITEALAALHELVIPGGRLLLGTQIWERPPTPELEAAVGSVPSLDELIDDAVAVGWRPLGLQVASLDDWDHFEFGFLADWEQFVMSPTSEPEGAEARRAADAHRAEYLGRRGTLGFAFLTLGRPNQAALT